jgi:hypothetical protein
MREISPSVGIDAPLAMDAALKEWAEQTPTPLATDPERPER